MPDSEQKHSGQEETLQSDAALGFLIQTVIAGIKTYLEAHEKGEVSTLREKQIEVLHAAVKYFQTGKTEGYIKLPTGSGKTVIFLELIEALGLKTLIVVPTNLLVDQTHSKAQEFAADLDLGRIDGYVQEKGKDVTVITYASLVNYVESGKLNSTEYDLLILDEEHRSKSELRQNSINKFTNALKIRFSATPIIDDPEKLIYSLSIKEAVEAEMLSSFSVILAETDIDLTDVKVTSVGEYDEEDLEKAINTEARNQSAVELYKEMFFGQKAVAYCVSIDHASYVASLFLKDGIPAAVISGKQSKTEQRKLLKLYQEGKILVLCNADLLIEGFDDVEASVCLNLRPTLSPIIAEQRGGRVLRLDPNNPSKHAFIVEFIDKSANRKTIPITFVDITEEAEILHKNIRTTSQRISERRGEATPENTIEISGLKVITDAKEVMDYLNNLSMQRGETYPNGWMPVGEIRKLISRSHTAVIEMANKLSDQFPDESGIYLSRQNTLGTYYSPRFVYAIKREFDKTPFAPDGWKTIGKLEGITGKSSKYLRKAVEMYRNDHPDWYAQYGAEKGGMYEHYSPQLVEQLLLRIQQENIPEGWLNINQIAEITEKSYKYIKRMASEYRKLFPDNVHSFPTTRGGEKEYFSPHIITFLKESDTEYAPDGWITARDIANQQEVSVETVKRRAEIHSETHPEWFQAYKSRHTEKVYDYYSPELSAVVIVEIKELMKLELVPAGWYTNTALATTTHSDHVIIRSRAQEFREIHPDWFQIFRNEAGRSSEYYSPELVQEILTRIGKSL